jgi:pSer/pThr/pTyr-binding forkhead associated (FHA) protein
MENQLHTLARTIQLAIHETVKLLPWRDFSVSTLAHQIATEVIATSRVDLNNQTYAPDQFTLSIHPHETGELQTVKPEIQDDLAQNLQQALEECNLSIIRRPHITLATDPTLQKGEIRVIAWHSADPREITPEPISKSVSESDLPRKTAFLVVEGRRHFPLNKAEITIGRRVDNDLVLDGHHVSRRHAQIRVHQGRYQIIDLDSMAGIKVNGRMVKEHILFAGDVISLADIELVYAEGAEGPPAVTPPYSPLSKSVDERDQETPLDLRRADFEDDTTPTDGSDG